jgi:hypothetical protein
MIIESLIKQKVVFDLDNTKHVNLYKGFLSSNRWGINGCPFILEFPYLTIPDMIKDKLIHKFLKVKKLR